MKNKIGQPFFDNDEYAHSVFCSGSRRYPRGNGLGNCCSCHSIDLYFNRLGLSFSGTDATRTIQVAVCPGCQKRTEFPSISEAVPREVFCTDCSEWTAVESVSWTGPKLTNLLPIFPR
jgi:hypothetical protein